MRTEVTLMLNMLRFTSEVDGYFYEREINELLDKLLWIDKLEKKLNEKPKLKRK